MVNGECTLLFAINKFININFTVWKKLIYTLLYDVYISYLFMVGNLKLWCNYVGVAGLYAVEGLEKCLE